jgi:hypothetical protein
VSTHPTVMLAANRLRGVNIHLTLVQNFSSLTQVIFSRVVPISFATRCWPWKMQTINPVTSNTFMFFVCKFDQNYQKYESIFVFKIDLSKQYKCKMIMVIAMT